MQTILELVLNNAVMATVLALLAAVSARCCRRPALVHGLWLLVLLKLVTPPLVPVSFPWLNLAALPLPSIRTPVTADGFAVATELQPQVTPSTSKATAEIGTPVESAEGVFLLELAVDKSAAEAPTPIGPANVAELLSVWVQPWFTEVGVPIWILGSLLWFGWTVMHSYRFQHLLRFARRAPASVQEQTRSLAAQMGLRDCPGVWLVPGAVSPMLWFAGRAPRLLFPAKLLDQLDREQRATLLVHELAHYRRRDHWLRFVEVLVAGLFWWHPVVWWARRELHEAEEQCCDAWVVWTLHGADRSYATALLQTVAFISQSRVPLPAAASGIGQVRHLRRRLTMIMQGKTPRSLSWAGVLAIVGLGVLLLPVYAQTPKGDTEQEIAKLKQALRALEQKHDLEQAEGAKRKASDEEIDQAKAVANKLGKVADIKRKEFEAAAQSHHQALARLAKLEGKPVHTYMYRLDGGKLTVHSPEAGYRVFADPAGKPGSEEHRTIILRAGPDGKFEQLDGKALALTPGKGEAHRLILSADADAKYDDVNKALKAIKEKGAGPIYLHVESPKLDAKPGIKTELDMRPGTENKRIIQYNLISPDAKAIKPGEKVHQEFEFKFAPGEKKVGQNYYRLEVKSPDDIVRVPDGKGGEKVFRYETQNLAERKPETARMKTPVSTSDKAADLERKIEHLQKEIQELKDALKKSGAALPSGRESLKGIATR